MQITGFDQKHFFLFFFIFFTIITCQQEKNKILFLSNREAPQREFDIFSMDIDGKNQTNLTKMLTQFNKILIYPTSVPDFTESLFGFRYSDRAMVKVCPLFV